MSISFSFYKKGRKGELQECCKACGKYIKKDSLKCPGCPTPTVRLIFKRKESNDSLHAIKIIMQ
jgi:hypothetical protein